MERKQTSEGYTTNFRLHQLVFSLHQPVFSFDNNLHYFCSYVTLRDGPASGNPWDRGIAFLMRQVSIKSPSAGGGEQINIFRILQHWAMLTMI